ncbi:unnamed protein product [Cuscuta campestris]|uniref:Transmembrane protein n=1 Tax=Cuscuta campestris TaxID=132261 RepID=A0A484KW22_9ASTE|nr:unnamed protein product [Cuscuta campestris]
MEGSSPSPPSSSSSSSAIFFSSLSIFLCFIPGLAGGGSDLPSSGTVASNHSSKKSSTLIGLAVCLVGAIVLIGGAVLVFKIWQKKRREVQHARLLKLFEEEDDDLNEELGI